MLNVEEDNASFRFLFLFFLFIICIHNLSNLDIW